MAPATTSTTGPAAGSLPNMRAASPARICAFLSGRDCAHLCTHGAETAAQACAGWLPRCKHHPQQGVIAERGTAPSAVARASHGAGSCGVRACLSGARPHTGGTSSLLGPWSLLVGWLCCVQMPGRSPACLLPLCCKKMARGCSQCQLPSCHTAKQGRRQTGLCVPGEPRGHIVVGSPYAQRKQLLAAVSLCFHGLAGQHNAVGALPKSCCRRMCHVIRVQKWPFL